MNNKKGVSFSMNMIAILILILIALVVAVVFINTQMTKGAKKYAEIGESLDKCESFFGNRECKTSCSPNKIVNPIGSAWSDCKTGEVCCEVD